MKENKLFFTVLPNASSVVKRYEVRGYPTLYYIDKQGKVAGSDLGFPGREAVEARVKNMLK